MVPLMSQITVSFTQFEHIEGSLYNVCWSDESNVIGIKRTFAQCTIKINNQRQLYQLAVSVSGRRAQFYEELCDRHVLKLIFMCGMILRQLNWLRLAGRKHWTMNVIVHENIHSHWTKRDRYRASFFSRKFMGFMCTGGWKYTTRTVSKRCEGSV